MHKYDNRIKLIRFTTSFLSFCIILYLMMYVFQRNEDVARGLFHIITSPAILITDFLLVGGVGGTFLNAGLIFLFNYTLVRILHIKISGLVIACFLTVFGFSFFGKNILNILPFYIGGILYCMFAHEDLKDNFITIAFSSALAPFVSEIAFQLGSNDVTYLNGIALGTFIGFIICPLAKKMYSFHEGYNLYNLGFTGGILGAAIASVLRLYNVPIQPHQLISTEHNTFLFILCSFVFTSLIFIGFLISDFSFHHYVLLLKDSGHHTDFTKKYGYGASYINMGMMGFLSLVFLTLEGQTLNGPMLAGILTVVGFSAYGKTPLNTIPILLGVHLASYGSSTSIFTICLSGLFGTALAPIAGVYGFFWGIVAGWLHLAIVQSIGIVHAGLNLYNNGFSCGIVASILLPIMNMISHRQARQKINVLKKHKSYIKAMNEYFQKKEKGEKK